MLETAQDHNLKHITGSDRGGGRAGDRAMSGRRFTASRARASRPKQETRRGRLTVRIRGKDDGPLSVALLKQGLYDLIGRLQSYSGYRVKCVALYLTVSNENGEEVSLDGKAVWNIWPYRAAADELDGPGGGEPDMRCEQQAGQGRHSAH